MKKLCLCKEKFYILLLFSEKPGLMLPHTVWREQLFILITLSRWRILNIGSRVTSLLASEQTTYYQYTLVERDDLSGWVHISMVDSSVIVSGAIAYHLPEIILMVWQLPTLSMFIVKFLKMKIFFILSFTIRLLVGWETFHISHFSKCSNISPKIHMTL